MTNIQPARPASSTFTARRRGVPAAAESWVEIRPLMDDASLPLVAKPTVRGVDLVAWASSNRARIDEVLVRQGGVLFRGFEGVTPAELERLIAVVGGPPMDYMDQTSPRSRITDKLYTSTEHPPDQPIALHNENSYSFTWPGRIFFLCVTPAASGGQTPIADCRRVLARIRPELRARFSEHGLVYVRNFGEGCGVSWQTAFQTDDPAHVAAFCRAARIACEWKDSNRLCTRQARPAMILHPVTGDRVWFNQATLFHISMLDRTLRDQLLDLFAYDDLPVNVCYGDGTPIADADVQEIADAYRAETVAFDWHAGDVLMLDNMLLAHGRAPFEGVRKIVVGMADPWDWTLVATPADECR